MSEANFEVRPMNVGAEIVGLAHADGYDPDVTKALYDVWMEYGILLFKNIDSTERHIALSRVFGELEIHPYPEVRFKKDERMIEVGGRSRGRACSYDGGELIVSRVPWHRDTAYTPSICKGAVFRMVEVPSKGGETMFCDTAKAYEDLPSELKARLEGLEYKASLRLGSVAQTRPGAFWKHARQATAQEDPDADLDFSEEKAARYPSVIHPAVKEHPETGRKCIFLSPTYVDWFIGLDREESGLLLNQLCEHMLQPRYIYTHQWTVNEAMLWDNRRFMHAALGCSIGEKRRGLRTTLAGPMDTGRLFDTSTSLAGLRPIAD